MRLTSNSVKDVRLLEYIAVKVLVIIVLGIPRVESVIRPLVHSCSTVDGDGDFVGLGVFISRICFPWSTRGWVNDPRVGEWATGQQVDERPCCGQ